MFISKTELFKLYSEIHRTMRTRHVKHISRELAKKGGRLNFSFFFPGRRVAEQLGCVGKKISISFLFLLDDNIMDHTGLGSETGIYGLRSQ